jgi:hypothetical protein
MALGFIFGQRTNTSALLPQAVSEAEAKLYVATWALMKAPFILSVDFARNSRKPESEGDWPAWVIPLVSNKHLIAVSQDPLSVQGHRLWSDAPGGVGDNSNSSAVFVPAGLREVWIGPLDQGDAAVMLVNKGESIAVVNVSFALAGFVDGAGSCGHNVSVFDVLGQRALGRWQAGGYGMTVQPHSAELVRIGC